MNENRLAAHRRFLRPWPRCFNLVGCVNQKKDIAEYRKVIDGDKPLPVHIEPGSVVTLTDALRLADHNEETLGIQGESYLQALITKDRDFASFSSHTQPRPNLHRQRYTRQPARHQRPQLQRLLGAGMNVFNGFSDYYTLKAADQTIEQQRQLLLDAQQTVLLDVITAYYTVLDAEQSVDVLTNSLKVQNENVRFHPGTGDRRHAQAVGYFPIPGAGIADAGLAESGHRQRSQWPDHAGVSGERADREQSALG